MNRPDIRITYRHYGVRKDRRCHKKHPPFFFGEGVYGSAFYSDEDMFLSE
jgi:hypothetical protein